MSKEKEKYYEVKYKKVITYRVIGKGIENGYSLNWIGEDDLNIDADMGWEIEPISPLEEYDIEGITQEEDDDEYCVVSQKYNMIYSKIIIIYYKYFI